MVSISLVHTDHAEPGSRPFTWVQDKAMAGGRLQGYGVHDLDLLLEAFGEVAEVAAATEVGVGERQAKDGTPHAVTAEDAYAILIRFRGGGPRPGQPDLDRPPRPRRRPRVPRRRRAPCAWTPTRSSSWGRAGEELQTEGPLKASSKDAFKHRRAQLPRLDPRGRRRPTPRCRRGCACRRCSTRSTSRTTSAAGSRREPV